MRKVADKLYCPVCKKNNLSVSQDLIDDPQFFPEGIVQISYNCGSCGFKASDAYSMKKGKPSTISLRVEDQADLSIRVVKSSTATIFIPEIGASVKPGNIADGYVTNVEGVLERIEKAFGSNKKAKAVIERLRGGEAFTLILEDLEGNSRILSPKAKIRQL